MVIKHWLFWLFFSWFLHTRWRAALRPCAWGRAKPLPPSGRYKTRTGGHAKHQWTHVVQTHVVQGSTVFRWPNVINFEYIFISLGLFDLQQQQQKDLWICLHFAVRRWANHYATGLKEGPGFLQLRHFQLPALMAHTKGQVLL